MRLLLDTHRFIWWDSEPLKLSKRALELLTEKDNLRLLSVVSLWEIQIKHQLGKLTLNKALAEIIAIQQNNYIEILPITIAHILALVGLTLLDLSNSYFSVYSASSAVRPVRDSCVSPI